MAQGWPLVGITAIAVSAMTGLIFASYGVNEEALHVALRATARCSALLFLAAFVAAPLRRAWSNDATRWLLRNRRYLGVSYATSHTVHLLLIIALGQVQDASYDSATVVGGGIAYLFIAAMTATSFDRSAAWLGPRRWRRLHVTGLYYNWFIFVITFAGTVVEVGSVISGVFTAALLLGLAARIELRRRRPSVRDGVIG